MLNNYPKAKKIMEGRINFELTNKLTKDNNLPYDVLPAFRNDDFNSYEVVDGKFKNLFTLKERNAFAKEANEYVFNNYKGEFLIDSYTVYKIGEEKFFKMFEKLGWEIVEEVSYPWFNPETGKWNEELGRCEGFHSTKSFWIVRNK